jgi:hypothetical protein
MIATILVILSDKSEYSQGFEKVMIAIFPLTNLLLIVFASAVIIIAIYFNMHQYYTSALPIWANNVLISIAVFIFITGIFGYYSGTRGYYRFLLLYILVLFLSSFICLASGLGMIMKTSTIKDAVSKDWPNIE